jgi:hypothetical protein
MGYRELEIQRRSESLLRGPKFFEIRTYKKVPEKVHYLQHLHILLKIMDL